MSGEDIRAGGAFWEILVVDNSGPALAEAEKAFARHQAKIAATGDSITKSLRTPREIYAETLQELQALRASGNLTAETFNRGTKKALQDFAAATADSFQRAADRVQMLGRNIAIVGAMLTAVAGIGLGGLGASLKEFADFGSSINDLTQRTGLDAAWGQSFQASAGLAGASMQDVEAAIRKMQKTLAKSGKLTGMPTEEQFMAVADEISKISDPTLRAAKAMEMFGKSGTKILPMIEGGAAALREQFQFLQSHGLILSDEDIKLADELGDAWDFLGMTMNQVVRIIGASLAPEVLFLAKAGAEVVAWLGGFIEQNRYMVKIAAALLIVLGGLGAAILAFGTAIMFVGGVVASFAVILPLLPGLIAAVGTAFTFMLSPLGLILGSVAALVAMMPLLAYVLDDALFSGGGFKFLTDGFGALYDVASQTFDGIFAALATGDWGMAGGIAMAGLNVAWTMGLSTLQVGFMQFADWLWKAMVDLFGSGLIGVILEGAKAVIEKINEAAALFGFDGIGSTAGLDELIEAASKGDEELRKVMEPAIAKVTEQEAAKVAAAKAVLGVLTSAAEDRRAKAAATGIGDAGAAASPTAFASKQMQAVGTFSAGGAALINSMHPEFDSLKEKVETSNELLAKIADNTQNDGEEEGAGE